MWFILELNWSSSWKRQLSKSHLHTSQVQYLILHLSQSTLQVGIKIRSLYWIQSVSQPVRQTKEEFSQKWKFSTFAHSQIFFLNLYGMQNELFIKECQSCSFIYSKSECWPLLSSKIYNEKWLTVNFSTHTELSYGFRRHVEYFDIVLSQRFIYLFIYIILLLEFNSPWSSSTFIVWRWAVTSPFVFHARENHMQVWNDMRESKITEFKFW